MTLSEFKIACRFLVSHGIPPERLIDMAGLTLAGLLDLAGEWSDVRRAEGDSPAVDTRIEDEARDAEARAVLFHSCGGAGPDDGIHNDRV